MAPPLSTSDTLETLLPPSLDINNKHEDVYLNICKILEKVIDKDINITTKECIMDIQNCLRVLKHALKVQYAVSMETRGKLVTLILKIVCRKEGNIRLHSALISICSLLMNNKYDKSQLPEGYVIDGELLHALVGSYMEHKSIFIREKPEYSTNISSDYIRKLHDFIKGASKYFTKEFSFKMLNKGKDLINSHASRITAKSYMGIGLIETFFHIEKNAAHLDDSFLDFIMELFQYSETLTSLGWRTSVLSLLMQVIKLPKFKKKFGNQYLRIYYAMLMTLVHVNPKQKIISRYELSGLCKMILGSKISPWKAIAVTIVETMENGSNNKEDDRVLVLQKDSEAMEASGLPLGMTLFQQLVKSVDTEFHPSTRVRFNAAGELMKEVAVIFAQRVGITNAEGNTKCYENSAFVDQQNDIQVDYRRGFNNLNNFKSTFVSLLLPLVLNSMYHRSHHFVESSMRTLVVLVQLDAAAVQKKLLPQIYRALDPEKSLSHAHQAPPALRALTYTFWHFSKNNLPEIVPHLHDILSLALPGIDSNDGMKTLHAMNFFAMFFGSFPLVDCSGDEWEWDEALNDNSDRKFSDDDWLRVKSTTAFLEEFAITFLNHMLAYAGKTGKENGQIDGGLSDDSNKSSSSNSYGILGISASLCLRFFFCNMSPSIRKVIITELAKHVLSTTDEMTMMYDCLLKFAGRYEPQMLLGLLTSSIEGKMFNSVKTPEEERVVNDDLAITSHVWYLKLLNASCKNCGNVCLEHKKFYIQVLKSSLHHTSEKVRIAGGDLFKSLLHNLLSSFVVRDDYLTKIFEPGLEEGSKAKNISLLYSRTCKRKDVKLIWHIPNAEEIQFVELLVSTFSTNSIVSLEELLKIAFVKSKNTLDEWKYNLDVLICTMEGVAIDASISNPLKIRLSTFCNSVFEYFGNDENSDPKILKKVIKLSALNISSNAATSESNAGRMEVYFFDALNNIVTNKIDMTSWLHLLKHSNDSNNLKHDRPFPVFISILMAESRQVRRILDRDEYDVEPYKDENIIIKKLAKRLILSVSQNVYRDVRTETCIALDDIISNRPEMCIECCKDLVGHLKKESPSQGHALGTLSVLMKKRILFSMRHNWEFLKEFYLAAISPTFIDSLSDEKKLEAQTILRSIIVAIAELKEKHVPGLNKETWNEFAKELIKSLAVEIDGMRWWHTMVASTYLLLSIPVSGLDDIRKNQNNKLLNSWFLNLVKRQELPLRRLALSAFTFEKIYVNDEDEGKIDVEAVLDAILQNHNDPRGANAPRSIWTPGVHQLLTLAGAGHFNGRGSNYASSWGTFKVGHAIVVSNFQFGENDQYRGRVLEYFNKLLEKADSKGIDKKTCNSISEIFSGCVRSGDNGNSSKQILKEFHAIVEKAISLTPLSWIHIWSVAYVAIVEDPNCYDFTCDVVIEKLKKEFDDSAIGKINPEKANGSLADTTKTSDVNLIVNDNNEKNIKENKSNEEVSFAGPSKWLNILSCMLQELAGYEDKALGQKLTIYSMEQCKPLIMRGLKSTFDSCRKYAAKCMAWLCIDAYVHNCKDIETQIQDIIKMELISDDASDPCVESACHLIKLLVRFGPTEYGNKYIVNLLPATMKFQNASAAGGKNAEKVALARSTASVAASSLVFKPFSSADGDSVNDFNVVWEFLLNGINHRSYHNRVAALAFLNTFYKNNVHAFSYDQNSKLVTMVHDCLKDKRPEVQECAQAVMMMMLLFIDENEQRKLCEIFSAMASTKVPKNKEKFPNKVKKAYRKRVAGVLGISAIVERNPYSIPDFIPDALVLMCQVASDPGSASGIIKRSLANFKRSHNDEWDEHKRAFTTTQLDWLQDFFLPNNYYA